MGKHTKEPWKVQHPHAGQRGWEIADSSGLNQVSQDVTEANALRIVACVNACEGMSNEELEGGILLGVMEKRIATLEQQRTELLACRDRLVEFMEAIADTCEELSNDRLANVRGGALGIASGIRNNLQKVKGGAA